MQSIIVTVQVNKNMEYCNILCIHNIHIYIYIIHNTSNLFSMQFGTEYEQF